LACGIVLKNGRKEVTSFLIKTTLLHVRNKEPQDEQEHTQWIDK
jgi:hypothetical protein